MIIRILKMLTLGAVFAQSLSAFAYDFKNADRLFVKRNQMLETVETARRAYREAIPHVSGEEKIYTFVQLARLGQYEFLARSDELFQLSENKEEAFRNIREIQVKIIGQVRVEIANRCLSDIENISGEMRNGKVVVEYYYWKAACLWDWSQASGFVDSIFRWGELLDTLKKGRAIAAWYEANGFDRIAAPLHRTLPAIAGGSLETAYKYVETAINSRSYGGDHPYDGGDYFFDAYYYKASILAGQGHKKEAIEVLTEAISRVTDGDYSISRGPETMLHARAMVAFLQELKK